MSWDKQRSLWCGVGYARGKTTFLGCFERAEDAAVAADRVTLGQGSSTRRLNFPRRGLTPASVQEMRQWAKELTRERLARLGKPGKRTTDYRGVRAEKGRFRAYVIVAGRNHDLGAYGDVRAAAVARDRAVLFFGLDVALHEPRRARRLGSCSPAELRREAVLAGRSGLASRFFGVRPNPHSAGWDATVTIDQKLRYIARFQTEIDAARAHDRAALALAGPGVHLNFPGARLRAASIEALRRDAAAAWPQTRTSAFHGVQKSPSAAGFCWLAGITVGCRRVPLGAWRTEREAALAHDRAALHVPGERRKLNHPAAARKLGAASPPSLRAQARRIYKETTTSRYRGVHWSAKDQRWTAKIGHRRRQYVLGYFRDEVRAAEAYDEAARRLHKVRAKPNFPT